MADGERVRRLGRRLILASASGLLAGLTTPTTSFIFLLPIALVPLMMATEGASVRDAALVGGTFGVLFWLSTVPWVAYTVHHFGEFAWPLAVLAVVITALILAVPFSGMVALVSAVDPRSAAGRVLTWTAAWVLQEGARTYLLGGFPWALLAAPLAAHPALAQSAALGGVFLTSALVVVVNGLLAVTIRTPSARHRVTLAFGTAILVASAWLLGAARIRSLATSAAPVLPRLRVTLIQPNVAQALRFTPEASEAIYRNLVAQTRTAAEAERPDLVLWPESAAPWAWQTAPRFQSDLLSLCREQKTAVLFNTVWSDVPEDDEAPYYNSALLVTAAGPVLPPYHKQRLVPFGEYVPLGSILRRIRPISRAVPGSFSPGEGGNPIPFGAWRLGGAVCYEVVYPWIARDHVRRGANLLFTLTNDDWYGTLGARRQHWQAAVYRAVETGVPLLRAAITGITGWIDPAGQGHEIPADRKGNLTVTLGGASGLARPVSPPPAVAAGDLLVFVCAAGATAGILRRRVFQPRRPAGAAEAAAERE